MQARKGLITLQTNSIEDAHPQLGPSYQANGPTGNGSVARSVLDGLRESCAAAAISGGAVPAPVGLGLPDYHAYPVSCDGMRPELLIGLMTVLTADVSGMLFKQLPDSYGSKGLPAKRAEFRCGNYQRLAEISNYLRGFSRSPRRIHRRAC
jgi:hypothetical protein